MSARAADDLKPRTTWVPIESVDNAALTEDDMMQFIVAAVNHEGLVGHNINAFNGLLDEGIPQILTELFHVTNVVKDHRDQTDLDRQRESIKIDIRFYDVRVGRPVYATYPIGRIMPLYPNETRLSGRTYAAPLSLAMEVVLTAYYADGREETKRAEIPPFQVANIPIMVGSNRCHTWNLTREARKALQEDPNESGGYFLAKGSEWVVDWLENISFNKLHVHARMSTYERVRGEFISQPGGAYENSSQVIIRYTTNGAITIEINSTKFSKTKIPFFLIFRILGMSSDDDILQQIVYDPASTTPVVRHMVDTVGRALQHEDPNYASVQNELDREKLTEFMAARLSKFVTNPSSYKSDEHAIQYLNDNLLGVLDRVLLPHMGRDASSRGLKLRFLGMLIHKTLLVDMGILEPTDRDSYSNKRGHGAAVSIAKAFKTQFNNSALTPVLRALKREVRNTSFEELGIPNIIDAAKNAMASSDLSRTLDQSITSGNKTILVHRRPVVNRVSTQALERKNSANVYSALRSVSTSNASKASKQTERADRMRRVHASYTGYICVAKSADSGEAVGMKKELAITAGVCSAGEPFPLILRLLEDPAVLAADTVRPPDIIRQNLACIFVNGRWIGCCRSAAELVGRYRALRRESRVVDPQTTIVWNPVTDDVDFLLDVGRLTRPLLIVDSNIAEYDAGCRAAHAAREAGRADWAALRVPFVQNIRLTPAHVARMRAGAASLEDLRAEGIVEWITPEEAENCLIAPSLDALRAARGDVTLRYTHCDVEQAIFGLTALVSPFGNHTQPARVTYETGQGRQAGGWYSFAAPFRVDKNRFFQYYCEVPLVRTLAYNWLFPNGMNTIVAYMIHGGYNQEDSAIVKHAFIQRGGFAGAYYRVEKAELEKGEFFGSPDAATTKNLKPNASYEKLVDGFVLPGTIVRKGDVLIGRIAKISAGGRRGARSPDDGYKFVDRSVVYYLAEPAVVVSVHRPRGPNDSIFGLVKLRYHRPLGVGDKMSSRAGNKCLTPDHDVLTARGWVPIAGVTRVDEVACLDGGGLVYRHPQKLHVYDYEGPLCGVTTPAVNLRVTPNHRMWVQSDQESFGFCEAQHLAGRPVRYARCASNPAPEVTIHMCRRIALSMDLWLHLLGASIRGRGTHGLLLTGLSEEAQSHVRAELGALAPGDGLPPYVWCLGQRQSRVLLEALTAPDPALTYITSSRRLADDVQRLALHAGWSANVCEVGGALRVEVHTGPEENTPLVLQAAEETHYSGKVHCLSVPGGVFYVRRAGRPVWTGNSIAALLLADSDLPYDDNGITPDIIINPHSIPSRMTIGQMLETSLGLRCQEEGVITDGTAFRTVSVDEIAQELADIGLRFNGLSRLYNGRTGEHYDAAIFMGPTYHQRLQKFVEDNKYAVSGYGPTDALTGQPLDGKNARGGLRVGEMESWVLGGHGAMMALTEKMFLDSDGRKQFLCRTCGLPAIHNAQQGIYNCTTCGEAADIGAADSCKASIVFQHEMRAANVKLISGVRPREFEDR